ncbi:MAG TPA: YigZ family protein [Treponema sp.]|jgi:uncharacterized YigZ family protein|nr:YigZ family protein [Treponema sp.]HBB41891.1 YigZ family protein [Treponema sp.]HCA20115.1 YigZ family protein [Treponema sp.]
MKILCESAVQEIDVKNSRFIAEAFNVESQSEAREKLHSQKERYSDASHVCHCFVVGPKGETNGMSDDGEPSGTAGRPMLDVLKGSGITNILVTVTRYFGGTLLGTGGLVRAYGDSVKAVLAVCKTEELVEKSTFKFSADYGAYEAVKRFYSKFHITMLHEDFGTDVNVCGEIWKSEEDEFSAGIKNLTKGKSEVILGGKNASDFYTPRRP